MRWLAGAASILLLASCAHTVDGAAGPAATAVTVLPTEEEITSAVGNSLSTFGFQPFVGGAEILPDGYRTEADASPIDCVGVTDTAPRIVYEPLGLVEAARQSYFNWDEGVDTSGADAAVLRLPTADAAASAFEAFVRQWQQCGGTTVVKHLGVTGNTGADSTVDATVSEVAVIGPMLSATVRTRPSSDAPKARYERVLGVRDDTIVEVSLALTPQGERALTPRGQAARVAQVMLDEVGRG